MQKTDSRPLPNNVSLPGLEILDAFARRFLDILASALGLLVLAPFFVILAFSIKRDSPGPIFYRGPRLGRNGRIFGILKFRTMYERPATYDGPRITASGDDRITPLGRWLRATKLNELPQLWNVLIGDMSLVGPRPEDPEIARAWPPELREQLLSVRPGITSPATVVFRSEEEMLQFSTVINDYLRSILPDKLRLDSNYIRNRNIITDLDVIFMTLALLMPRIRSLRVPETLLYWGPLAQFVSRYLNWFVMDTIVAFGAIGISGLIWRADAPLNLGLRLSLLIAIGVSFCFSTSNALLHLNQVQWRRAPADSIIPLAFSTGLATLALLIFDILFLKGDIQSRRHLPLGMLIFAGGLSLTGFVFFRFRERLLSGIATYWLRFRGPSTTVGERLLIIGAGNNSQFATWLLTHSHLSRAFSIVGMVDDDPRKQGMYFDGYPVLGSTRDLPAIIQRHKIGLALFTISNISEHERHRILRLCNTASVQVVIFPDVIEDLSAHFFTAQCDLSHQAAPGD